MGIHIFCKLGGWGWRTGIRRRWISIWIGNGHLERKGVATLRITHRTPQAITSNQFSLYIITQKFHYDYVITNYFMNIILSIPTYNDKDTLYANTNTNTYPSPSLFQIEAFALKYTIDDYLRIYLHTNPIQYYPYTNSKCFTFYDYSRFLFQDSLTMSNDMQS
jgi:hypothetical protein